MNAYLSIDLDYWQDCNGTRMSTRFFNKVLTLNVPTVVVIEHEELVPDINKMKNLDIVYNVDYHSDIIAESDAGKKPEDYDWANFIRGSEEAEFCWLAPLDRCYMQDYGVCHGDGIDPFCKQKDSGWKKCTWGTDLRLIDWKSIRRVGICISPCFLTVETVSVALEKLQVPLKKIYKIVKENRHKWDASKRKRGVLKRIAA